LGILDLLERIYAWDALLEKAPRLLGSGAFRSFPTPPIPLFTRLRALFFLFRRYLLTRNAAKRRLVLDLLRLVRSGRAQMGAVVQLLLFMVSFEGYLRFCRGQQGRVLQMLERDDS